MLTGKGFNFVGAGRRHLKEIRAAIRLRYPELCDDSVKCHCYHDKNDGKIPEWWHRTRAALESSKGKWVEKRPKDQNYWIVLPAGGSPHALPEELRQHDQFVEGAKCRIVVNAYERAPGAREACLKHWGYACGVCKMSLSEMYGPSATELIHVHHLRQLGSIGEAYVVDPVDDLRPVCPSCHMIIHSREPMLSLDEAKRMLINCIWPRQDLML